MKNYVIAIEDIEKSDKAANRCIKSGERYKMRIDKFNAITPRNTNIIEMAAAEDIALEGFKEEYSRFDNCVAAFLSHYSLWKKCVEDNEVYTIFEHDAVLFNYIPDMAFDKVISLGHPSYGRYKTPRILGVNPLVSKRYFPGAHAYRLNPAGAKLLIDQAKIEAKPTDVFLHTETFPFLQEYYPWPVEVRETFTTIQNVAGCWAKHRFDNNYEII